MIVFFVLLSYFLIVGFRILGPQPTNFSARHNQIFRRARTPGKERERARKCVCNMIYDLPHTDGNLHLSAPRAEQRARGVIRSRIQVIIHA